MLEKHFGACKFIYNRFLDIRRTLQAEYHCNIQKAFLDEQLPILKEEYPWLKEVNSQSLLHDRDINAAINIKKFAISAYQITAGTAGRACGLGKNNITAKNEAGSLKVLA